MKSKSMHGFTLIPKEIIQNRDISICAKALFAVIESYKQQGQAVSLEDAKRALGLSDYKLKECKKELLRWGLLSRGEL